MILNKADTNEEQMEFDGSERKRTTIIWLIFVYSWFTLLNYLWLLYIFFATDGAIPGLPESYLTPVGLVFGGIETAAIMLGGFALFNLRAKVIQWFTISIVIGVVQGAYSIVVSTAEPFELQAAIFNTVINSIIGLAILYYAWRLSRKGVLI